jgi:hypothetical protein
VIVHFPVEDDYCVAVGRKERLSAGFEVDDLQPGDGERDGIGLKNSLLVGPAVANSFHRFADPRRIRPPPQMRKSGNAAQDSNLAKVMAGSMMYSKNKGFTSIT